MHMPDENSELLSSAAARAEHMAKAIRWYHDGLRDDEHFRMQFSTLVSALAEAEACHHNEGGFRRQVHFVAVGKSGGVAALAANMLTSVGILARFLHPGEALHGDLGSVCEHDTVVCISNRGATREILNVLPMLRDRSCRLFAITCDLDSPLARGCDYVLPLPQFDEACPIQQAPITSTVTSLALCQLLVAASVERRSFNVTRYAKNHPGGSIGRRIYLRVSDIMLKDDDLPLCQPEETFQNCVSALTRHAKSCLLVVDGQRLLGVIAEKDIRVAMERFGPEVFSQRADSLMNPTPLTIEPTILAVDALKFMKDRKSPLNFLPVVDEGGGTRVVGLLRLHELVAAGINVV